MNKTTNTQPIDTKNKVLFLIIIVLTIALPYYLDSIMSSLFDSYVFWGILGVWGVIFLKTVLKFLAFKLFQFKHKPHNKLNDFQKLHYKHLGNMNIAYPSYTEDGVVEYKKTTCYFYKKYKKSPSHYPCFLLKPLVGHQFLKDSYYLWNDSDIKLLKEDGPLTVGDWFLKNDYNYFDDVKTQFDDNFAKNKEMSNSLIQILYLICLAGFLALYFKTPIGPLTSSFIAFLAYYLIIVAMGIILELIVSKEGKNSIINHPFWDSVKDKTNYSFHLSKLDFSSRVLMASALKSCLFYSEQEGQRIKNAQTIEKQPDIDVMNPVSFEYNPNLESWRGRIKLFYNSKKGPFDKEREQLARRVEKYLADNRMDFLNLSESERQQLLERFDNKTS